MRTIAMMCLGAALAGCGGTPNHRLIAPGGSPAGNLEDLFRPGEREAAYRDREKARQAADEAKCRELGFKAGTEAYGNCRLQLEQIRATKAAAAATQAASARAGQDGEQGLSLLCKDAISRRDSGGTFVNC